MSAAEFRLAREFLGLTTFWLAARLGVTERTVTRWENERSAIPLAARDGLADLSAVTTVAVSSIVEACHGMRRPVALTYRCGADYRCHLPDQLWPAKWHRAVVARVRQEVPGLVVDYWSPPGG